MKAPGTFELPSRLVERWDERGPDPVAPVGGPGAGVAPHMPLRARRRAPTAFSIDPWRASDPMTRGPGSAH
jgi:hypothetical protein